jgi:hypothetical protein
MSSADTTVVQRILSSTSLALESTMLRLRRLNERDVPEVARESAGEPASCDGPAGKIEHDARGSAVWNWAIETGTHAIESTQRLLKRLEKPELSLEQKPKPRSVELERDSGGGYDPYNQGRASKSPRRPR